MGLLQKVIIDCSQPQGQQATTVPLSADEIAAYNAQQPIGAAQAAAQLADLALRAKHTGGLGQIKAALTTNSTVTASDLTALPAIVTALQASPPTLTAAQQVILDRIILRILAVLLGS